MENVSINFFNENKYSNKYSIFKQMWLTCALQYFKNRILFYTIIKPADCMNWTNRVTAVKHTLMLAAREAIHENLNKF
jgi:hypothetical protein